ncbi:MAG: DUF5053 domain-containing protein [Bacteroides sp.]|nr:DUF5053 domain-containing protein [Bacteroides sp.]MCM1380019.1 DUF5053 domain-containing protein [Bacteroides sp.]MCM1446301.1 DUF5053 domain-containing protein [Prevotella sp.]
MSNILQKIGDLVFYVKFGKISKDYFGYSSSWLYQRLNGYDGNSKPCELTEEQTATLKSALHDLADKINAVADTL